jgi:hypothetical protein
MSLLETILAAILASGAWLILLTFLGKSLIANWLSKDVEQLKGRIAAQNIEKQIVLSRINEKRAEAISQIYLGLMSYVDDAKKFVHQAEHVDEEKRDELLNSISDSANYFREIYRSNHLYLSKTTCKNIQTVFREAQIPVHQYIFALGTYVSQGEAAKESYVKEFHSAFVSFADKIPPILEDLESQFRELLGVEN